MNKSENSLKTNFFNLFRSVFKNKTLEQLIADYSQGKEVKNPVSKIIPNNYQYAKNSFRNVTRNEINYKLDISDVVDWFIYFGLKDDAHDALFKMCNEDNVVFDVGTNIGSVLMNIAKKVGINGRVYGFEPDPANYKKCMTNMRLNNFKNISVLNSGLGEKKSNVFLKVDVDDNRGMNRVEKNKSENSVQITLTTMDDFVIENNIKKLDLIKIDVEGYEYNVLKGAQKTITSLRPKMFIEINDDLLRLQEASAKSVIFLLNELNYKAINSRTSKTISVEDDFEKCHFDAICIPN